MAYDPKPLDTSGITLSNDLLALTERLAENTHDVWASQRLADGWIYGPQRDDTAKTHPDLLPYSDLPDGEKEYDRKTAIETLRMIIALGYEIKQHE